ncbi:TetR/AcrR family transcriptional regulator [Pseudooceanicola nanhaiensis]|uniref:TetR/AcrR family transcriptional regulator n=1 Tax=Pseudooceanicola nanhaiensis TaxID=375761 RepID=UPI001CD72CAA|nr:TetR family transcriptional regulator [Pseudooceanicola nanhaiensis]MCA0920531.1 TetR family transcriptional regulator [Pseudooceanicola nanhaiensis]
MSRKQRLSPDDWLKAGLDALAAAGPEALKAEALARGLDTTKGSFYWHFPDVPAYRKALLDFWGDTAGAALSEPEDKTEAVGQLHKLMQEGFSDSLPAEAAMRAWARTEPTAAATLAEIDARRLAHLEKLLRQIGVTNPEIARILYAAQIGSTQLPVADTKKTNSAMGTLVDLVLALR